MYTLREYLCAEVGLPRRKVPSDKFFCAEIGTKEATRINHMHSTLACYAYTLVSQGWIRVMDNGQEHELRRGDLFIYVAGNQESVTGCSADFHAISLIADEIATIETHAIHRITSASPYSSFVHLRQTALHLSTNAARLLWRRMKEMADYIQAGHRNLDDYLSAFYSLFLLDLENEAFRIITPPSKVSERSFTLFTRFMQLLSKDFTEHHDIGHYASELCITTTHLSRITHQITGRTVVEHINHRLLREAMQLLHHTDLSIANIADRLHFADSSSFSRFFIRMKGVPLSYFK